MLTRQRIISFILTLLILIIGAVVFKNFSAKKESTVSEKPIKKVIRTVTAGNFPPSKIKNKIEVDGRLNAYEKINIAAEVQGRLLSIGKVFKVGTTFSKGDLLFKVESEEDEFSLKAQRSQLYTSITQVMPDLKFDHPNAYDKWLNYLNEFNEEKAVKPLPEITDQKEKYFIGGKNILNLYYTIKSQEERMKNYNVYAPFNGVFLTVNSYPGSLVSPGISLGQIMNTYQYELVAPIAMEAMKYVSVGQRVTLFSEGLGKSWTGKVSRTSKQIDQTTQSIPVYISVSGQGLRDGMYLKGTLGGSEISGVSVVPKDVIVNQNEVYVLTDSTINAKEVEIINFLEKEVYVKGIEADDQIITSSTNNLFEGQTVKLEEL